MQTAPFTPVPLLLLLCLCPTALAKNSAPLFADSDVLKLTIEAPFKKINRERDKEKQYPGAVLSYNDKDGNTISLPVALQVRGNSRLAKETCRYSPLRIHFDKESVKGTLFKKQRKLKLAVLCKKPRTYQDYLMQEYLIYKMFNLLTDSSFKVRLVEVTYLDGSTKPRTSHGFFIEDKKRLAKRLGLVTIKGNRIPYTALDPTQASLVSLFMFMVGNTDYSVIQGEGEEDCCHNAKILGKEGQAHTPVPYDFDFSGLINAKYAVPPEGVSIKNVRTRLYRGFCKPDSIALQDARKQIQQQKDSFSTLIETNEYLSGRARKSALKYLDAYFKISDSDKNFSKKVVKKCRGKK